MSEHELIGMMVKIVIPLILTISIGIMTILKTLKDHVKETVKPFIANSESIEKLTSEIILLTSEIKHIVDSNQKRDEENIRVREDIDGIKDNISEISRDVEGLNVRTKYLEDYGCKNRHRHSKE